MRIEMKKNKMSFFDIGFNILCMIYALYRWKLLTAIGLATSRTQDDGQSIVLTVGAIIAIIVFLVLDFISMKPTQREEEFLWSGYVRLSIGVKVIAIAFIIVASVFNLSI